MKKEIRNILVEMIEEDLSFYETESYKELEFLLIQDNPEFNQEEWDDAEEEGNNVYIDSLIDNAYERIKKELLGLSEQ
jgi:hypothetical protein